MERSGVAGSGGPGLAAADPSNRLVARKPPDAFHLRTPFACRSVFQRKGRPAIRGKSPGNPRASFTPQQVTGPPLENRAAPTARIGGGRRSGWGGTPANPPGFKLKPRA